MSANHLSTPVDPNLDLLDQQSTATCLRLGAPFTLFICSSLAPGLPPAIRWVPPLLPLSCRILPLPLPALAAGLEPLHYSVLIPCPPPQLASHVRSSSAPGLQVTLQTCSAHRPCFMVLLLTYSAHLSCPQAVCLWFLSWPLVSSYSVCRQILMLWECRYMIMVNGLAFL